MRGGALAVTLGDPRGIGPEVMERAALAFRSEAPRIRLRVLAPPELAPVDLEAAFDPVEGWDGTQRGAGEVSVRALQRAVELALDGEVAGVVTGPVHKPALQEAGWEFPGQTELLKDLTGVPRVGMLMAAERTRVGGSLRVLLATTHVALRDVPELLTPALLRDQTRLLHRELRDRWGLPNPQIALCAFNPHASDGGLFGMEESRVYEPALELLLDDGVEAAGPVPADTVFQRMLEGEFDAVVAPYHDVGMAAFKTSSFGTGVNVTLGLPFVRTSPDHGTAFGLVGAGRADPSSALEAFRLARRLAGL